MYDAEHLREELEKLPPEMIDDLRAARPRRHERHGWAYDPEWRYFVNDASRIQNIVIRPSVEGNPDWGAQVGLDAETVTWLIAHPTEGAYRSAR